VTTKYTKLKNIPNERKISYMVIKYTNNFNGPPKCTEIGLFGRYENKPPGNPVGEP
jgi:hypothetical protein